MTKLSEAFDDAKRYELYLYTKINAKGYLIWAGLGSVGSLISYLLTIFGSALGLMQSQLGPAIGFLWLIILGVGALYAFRPSMEDYSKMDDIEQREKIGSKIGIGWFFSFIIAFALSFILNTVVEVSDPFLVAIPIALSLGNFWVYYNVGAHSKVSLYLGIFMLPFLPLIAITPVPYVMLVFGAGLALPYYLVGFHMYTKQLPSILAKRD